MSAATPPPPQWREADNHEGASAVSLHDLLSKNTFWAARLLLQYSIIIVEIAGVAGADSVSLFVLFNTVSLVSACAMIAPKSRTKSFGSKRRRQPMY